MVLCAGASDDRIDAYPRRGHIAVVVIGYEDDVDPNSPMLADLVVATRRAADMFPRGTAPSGEPRYYQFTEIDDCTRLRVCLGPRHSPRLYQAGHPRLNGKVERSHRIDTPKSSTGCPTAK